MNFLISFWGLLVERIDFWEVWRGVVDTSAVEEVAWVVEQIQRAGYEVPLDAVAHVLAHRTSHSHKSLATAFTEAVRTLMKPMPCLQEFYSAIASRGRIAILSNTPCRCFIEDFLDRYRLHVDAILTSDVLLRRKPSKSVFRFALSRLRAQPHKVVYFGDGPEDLGALGVGVFTVMVGADGGHISLPDLCNAANWVVSLERL